MTEAATRKRGRPRKDERGAAPDAKSSYAIAVLCAPCLSQTPAEWRHLQAVKHRLLRCGYVPIFLPEALDGILRDTIHADREMALSMSQSFVRQIRAHVPQSVLVVVGERVTAGMAADMREWGTDRVLRESDVWGQDGPRTRSAHS